MSRSTPVVMPTEHIIPVSDGTMEFADRICQEISRADIRADVDDRDDTVGKKIRNAEREWVPYIIVVGPKEQASGSLSVRRRDERDQIETEATSLVELIRERIADMPVRPLPLPARLSHRPVFYG